MQEASPGADGSEAFRSLPEGVLCCLEVTGERVAGRGADGHCAGGGMDTGGRRTHLLADAGFPREAWHPSSAPEMTVMDKSTRKAAKHGPATFHAAPGRRIAPPSRRAHGIRALWICTPASDPQLGCQLPGSAVQLEVRRDLSH